MSPASLDALEVERYVGACLFSQNRTKNYGNRHQVFSQNSGYVNYQNCPSVERWVGGAPLISFAGHHRPNRRHNVSDDPNNHLAQLAEHTKGAPLILTKTNNHRKNKHQRSNNLMQQTKVFENSSNKKHVNQVNNIMPPVDSMSVTSDESSGSQNSEMCLPRIIKPRKRRKKDRKPSPPLNRLTDNEEFPIRNHYASSTQIDHSQFAPYFPFLEPFNFFQSPSKEDNNSELLGDIPEAPKLHHSFEEVEEVQDVNGNQPVSTCQCRYCDPEGQIWDVDRSCYSPFLTPPKTFDFSGILSSYSPETLLNRLSSLSIKEDRHKQSFARSVSSSSTSSSSSSGDLEVSTEIVTSLNGHRDLEIKFWLNGAVDSKSQLVQDKT